jgi:hypothetical protein
MPGMAASPLQTAATPAFTGSVDHRRRVHRRVQPLLRDRQRRHGEAGGLQRREEAAHPARHPHLDIKVDERDTVCIISGISQTLVGEVGVDPANARVTWTITLVGCATC